MPSLPINHECLGVRTDQMAHERRPLLAAKGDVSIPPRDENRKQRYALHEVYTREELVRAQACQPPLTSTPPPLMSRSSTPATVLSLTIFNLSSSIATRSQSNWPHTTARLWCSGTPTQSVGVSLPAQDRVPTGRSQSSQACGPRGAINGTTWAAWTSAVAPTCKGSQTHGSANTVGSATCQQQEDSVMFDVDFDS